MTAPLKYCFGMPGYIISGDFPPDWPLIIAACDHLKQMAERMEGKGPFTYWAKTDVPEDKWDDNVVGFVIYIEWMQ